MEQFLQAETLIIELLLVASLVATAVQRFRIPYTVALVVVGLLITFQQPVEFEVTPELILALFVPPLVFEAAFHLNLAELWRNLPVILLLAVPGVLLSTLEAIKPALSERIGALADDVRAVLKADASLEADEAATARREMLHAERSALSELLRSGGIAEEVYEALSAEVDAQLAGGQRAAHETV